MDSSRGTVQSLGSGVALGVCDEAGGSLGGQVAANISEVPGDMRWCFVDN